MNQPKVSIIIPVYNSEKYLESCLISIIKQDYSAIEVVLVDDGSQDNSGLICDRWSKKYTQITVIHQNNQGVAAARISGYRQSSGDFVMFIDSDDYIKPGMVTQMVSCMINQQVDMVCCQYEEYQEGKIFQTKVRPPVGRYNRQKLNELLSNNFLYDNRTYEAGMNLYLVTKLIKRSKYVEKALLNSLGLWYGEDMVAVLTLCYSVPAIYVLQDSFYVYRRYNEQVTKQYRSDLVQAHSSTMHRIIDIDKNHFLHKQIPLRSFNTLGRVTRKMVKSGLTYNQFKIEIQNEEKSFLMNLAMKVNSHDFSWKDKFKFQLFYKKFYFFYYVILKIKG